MKRKWNAHGFLFTTYEAELQKLIDKKVKGHSFYLNPTVTKNFYENLSNRTGGKAEEFLINDNNATKQFTDFVAERIIENIGDLAGGDAKKKMLEIYRKIY